MTTTAARLLPIFESSAVAVPDHLGISGVRTGNVVAIDDPTSALPVGPVRRVRGAVADGAGVELVVALTDGAATQAVAAAGTGDDLAGALLPALSTVLGGIGALTGATVELAGAREMSAAESLGVAGSEAFTAGLFVGDEQVGNLIFFAAPGALMPADGLAAASFPDTYAEIDTSSANPLSLLRGVEMRVTAELGRTRLPVSHVLDLAPGAVVELDRVAGSPVDVLVNGTIIAHGEVVVIDEEYGVRITEIVGAEDE